MLIQKIIISLFFLCLSNSILAAEKLECNRSINNWFKEETGLIKIPYRTERGLVRSVQALVHFRESHGGFRSCFSLLPENQMIAPALDHFTQQQFCENTFPSLKKETQQEISFICDKKTSPPSHDEVTERLETFCEHNFSELDASKQQNLKNLCQKALQVLDNGQAHEEIALFCEQEFSDKNERGNDDWLGSVEGGVLGDQASSVVVKLIPGETYKMLIHGYLPPHSQNATSAKTNKNDDGDPNTYRFLENRKPPRYKTLEFLHPQKSAMAMIIGFEDNYAQEEEHDYDDIIIEICLRVDY